MTKDHPSPYLVESQIRMLGRMGRGWTPRRRLFARLFAALALLPFLLGIVVSVVQMLR
ncbi:hypothetical protein GCM10027614_33640 [Micromonospora vulcania]